MPARKTSSREERTSSTPRRLAPAAQARAKDLVGVLARPVEAHAEAAVLLLGRGVAGGGQGVDEARAVAGDVEPQPAPSTRVSSAIEPATATSPFRSTTTCSHVRSTSGSRCEQRSKLFPWA
jgi:hypothetical protein